MTQSQPNQNENKNPFELVVKTVGNLAQCVQIQFSNFINGGGASSSSSSSSHGRPPSLFSISSSTVAPSDVLLPVPKDNITAFPKSANPVTKEELGRATWTLLHTLAAQFPDRPTRQQKKDVKELMAILSRLYPCRECADHFKDVLSANPVQAGSQAEFSQWLCHVHNVVNRSIGKLVFPCQRIDARWGKLECKERACDLEGTLTEYRSS